MANFTIKKATRERCVIYPVDQNTILKFTPISLELYSYLFELKRLDFPMYFRLKNEIIEYMKPSEFCHAYLEHIWRATQKKASDIAVCIRNKDRKKFEAAISHVRQRKINALLEKDSSLDRKTLMVFNDLSGASQMIVKGGIDKEVAKRATQAASYMVQNLMNSEAAMGTLSRMVSIDPTLYDHSAAVAMFSGLMATRFAQNPLSEKDAAIVAQCGLYHDTGKTCVPSAILNKPGSFTDEEYEVMKSHTHLGSFELQKAKDNGAPIDDLVVRVALEHHERFLGHGYPFGRKGRLEEDPENGIHLYSRFVAIADAYSALLMKRVYKPALSSEKAISLMSKNAPKDFDMEIYASFISTIRKSIKNLADKKLENEMTLNVAKGEKVHNGGTLDYSLHHKKR